MKIALVRPYNMVEHAGGVQQHVLLLKNNLLAFGHTVRIITPRPIGYQGEPPRGTIFLGRSQRLNRFLATSGDVSLQRDSELIEKTLNNENFDVIHFHEPWVPIIARQIMGHSRAAHIGTWHASLYESPGGKSLANIFASYGRPIAYGMHARTAVSPAAAAVLHDKSDLDVEYVPNGIDLQYYSEHSGAKRKIGRKKSILYIGRLEKRKGLKHLLDAYAVLKNKDASIELIIAGSGPDENKLKDYTADLKIKGVKFLGYISEDKKLDLLHSCNLFCSPARYGESFGTVLLEAMAARIPLVAGDNLGYRSVMTGTGQISLVNSADSIDFARRLDLLLNDVKLRELWLNWSDDYVKNFDFSNITKQYIKVYEKAIREKNRQET